MPVGGDGSAVLGCSDSKPAGTNDVPGRDVGTHSSLDYRTERKDRKDAPGRRSYR